MNKDPMDWDKILARLDPSDKKNIGDMSEEEIDMLLFAEQVQGKLHGEKFEEQFSLSEGMREFAYRKKKLRLKRMISYAAAILAVVGIGIWITILYQHPEVDGKLASLESGKQKGIVLYRGNGEEVPVDTHHENISEQGSEIQFTDNSIRYISKDKIAIKGDELVMDKLVVPSGERTKIELSDGTQVWLNAGTSIKFPVVFTADTREVYLEGEAYFDVAHNANKTFIVHSGDLQIKVLGTAFGVNTFSGEVKTALVRGSVELQANKQTQRLAAGEVGQYSTSSTKLFLSNDEVRPWVAWKDHILYFDDVDLFEITERLGRTYDYQFVFDHPSMKNLRFTIDIDQPDDIQTILTYLKTCLDTVDFKINGRTIHVLSKQ
ncbi:FecR domain-containing protein [Sphingobacterium sp.]|uniref:FecR family protein n=1 Tax=Sphingobacterium sp. TaxID=341027 RepID=UPI0031D8671E